MKFAFILVLGIFFSGINSQAQSGSYSDQDELNSDYQNAWNKLHATEAEVTREMDAIKNGNGKNSGLTYNQTQEKAKEKEYSDITERINAGTTLSDAEKGQLYTWRDQVSKDEAQFQKWIDIEKPKVDQLQKKLETNQQDFANLASRMGTDQNNLTTKLNTVEAQYSNLTWQTKIKDAEGQINAVQNGWQQLEAKGDNSLLKVYIQSKLNKLLNSDVLCRSVSSCSQGSRMNKNLNNANDMSEVFGATPKANTAGGNHSSSQTGGATP